jgi:hypothetical protein
MIRAESFAVTTEDFAAERKQVLSRADADLRPAIKDALTRIGLPSWQTAAVDAALEVFDQTARSEVDEWNQILDDMRDAFEHELSEALKLTKRVDAAQAEHQVDTITRWISTMAVNAGTEAATTSDPDGGVGLEWITMSDSAVRHSHQEANGQTVPTGQAFNVGGEELLYPGQPVGDPSVWINCRCVVRPTMLTEAASKTITAATDVRPSVEEPQATPDAGDQIGKDVSTTCVIVALPAEDDPISAASSEADGAHATLLFFGDTSALNRDELATALERFVTGGEVGIITEQVNGRATLGKDAADVVLFDAANLVFIRSGLLEDPVIAEANASVEQFPTWLPHVTLGYPETPAAGEFSGEAINFDRLALWFGEDRTAIYPLGEAMPEKPNDPMKAKKFLPASTLSDVIYPEDPRFTQEMADALFAGIPEKPADPAPEEPAPAEAPAEAPAPAEEPVANVPDKPGLRPWHGVLAPEGAPSGDKREFAERMLTTRDLPLPIKAMFTDDEGHKGSVVVARIDEVYRHDGLIKASGVWDDTADADRAFDLVEKKMWRGVSVDLDAAEGEMVQASEEDGGGDSIQFTQGRISAATLCAIPAFAEAFVRNGTWAEFANEPMPTGAMVPIPDWPGEEAPEPAPAFTLVASAAPKLSADYFRNPMLEENTPVTLGENGHIFGHLATWDTCHVGYEVCTTAPSSAMDYAYFLTGQVFTDAGPVAVGQITLGGGHADGRLGVRAAIAHYDNVATAVADINVGEDDHGIWFSGKLRDGLTEKQLHELFAAGPSGDWRGVRAGGNDSMEMIAAHAVNVPGFPVPRPRFAMEGTRQVSLIAAGAVATVKKPELDADFVAKLDAYHAMKERQEAVSKLRTKVRTDRAASIKSAMLSLKGN